MRDRDIMVRVMSQGIVHVGERWEYRSQLGLFVGWASILAGVAILLVLLPVVIARGTGVPAAIAFFGLVWLGIGFGQLRTRSMVGPEGVSIEGAVRRRRYRWDDIEGFRWAKGGFVNVVLRNGELVQLPAGSHIGPRRQREVAQRLCVELEGLRPDHTM